MERRTGKKLKRNRLEESDIEDERKIKDDELSSKRNKEVARPDSAPCTRSSEEMQVEVKSLLCEWKLDHLIGELRNQGCTTLIDLYGLSPSMFSTQDRGRFEELSRFLEGPPVVAPEASHITEQLSPRKEGRSEERESWAEDEMEEEALDLLKWLDNDHLIEELRKKGHRTIAELCHLCPRDFLKADRANVRAVREAARISLDCLEPQLRDVSDELMLTNDRTTEERKFRKYQRRVKYEESQLEVTNSQQNQPTNSQPEQSDEDADYVEDVDPNLRNLLGEHQLDYLLPILAKKGFRTTKNVAGLRKKDISELNAGEQRKLDGVIKAAEVMVLLETNKIERLYPVMKDLEICDLDRVEDAIVGKVYNAMEESPEITPLTSQERNQLWRMVTEAEFIASRRFGVKDVNIPEPTKDRLEAFNHYTSVGRDMRVASEESASSQAVREIEDILEEEHTGESGKTEDEVGEDGGEGISTDKQGKDAVKNHPHYFFALQAASLSGKTQLAFALRQRRPLYFAFWQCERDDTMQPIYGFFKTLNEAFTLYAVEDEKVFGHSEEAISRISPSNLLHRDYLPFWVLGLLEALILDGESYVSRSNRKSATSQATSESIFFEKRDLETEEASTYEANDDWMKFFSRKRGFRVRPLTIADFLRSPASAHMSKYVLFLDELSTNSSWALLAAFVRNLALAVGFKVVCAGSTEGLSKLVGEASATASAANKGAVWCVVLPNMPPPSPALVTRGQALVEQLPNCHPILQEFLVDQIKISRGGVSHAITAAVEDILKTSSFEVEILQGVLQRIVSLLVKIEKRKLNNIGARKAAFALFLCNYYDIEEKPKANVFAASGKSSLSSDLNHSNTLVRSCFSSRFKRGILKSLRKLSSTGCGGPRSSLELSYFKIIVPKDSCRNKIVLVASHERLQESILYRSEVSGKSQEWLQQTWFPRDEVILQLASFLVETKDSIRGIVEYEHDPCMRRAVDRRLVFENTTHFIMIDTSHRSDEHPLGGLEIVPVLKRVVRNFDFSVTGFEDATSLCDLLQGLFVPFLNAADLEWSKRLLEFAEGCHGINFGRYRRAKGDDGIDASFEIRIGSPECCAADHWFSWGLLECRYVWSVNAGSYFRILEKGWKWASLDARQHPRDGQTVFHLTICNRLAKFKPSYIRSMAQSKNWCAFAVRKQEEKGNRGTLVVDPIIPPRTARPAMVGIVIVTNVVKKFHYVDPNFRGYF